MVNPANWFADIAATLLAGNPEEVDCKAATASTGIAAIWLVVNAPDWTVVNTVVCVLVNAAAWLTVKACTCAVVNAVSCVLLRASKSSVATAWIWLVSRA